MPSAAAEPPVRVKQENGALTDEFLSPALPSSASASRPQEQQQQCFNPADIPQEDFPPPGYTFRYSASNRCLLWWNPETGDQQHTPSIRTAHARAGLHLGALSPIHQRTQSSHRRRSSNDTSTSKNSMAAPTTAPGPQPVTPASTTPAPHSDNSTGNSERIGASQAQLSLARLRTLQPEMIAALSSLSGMPASASPEVGSAPTANGAGGSSDQASAAPAFRIMGVSGPGTDTAPMADPRPPAHPTHEGEPSRQDLASSTSLLARLTSKASAPSSSPLSDRIANPGNQKNSKHATKESTASVPVSSPANALETGEQSGGIHATNDSHDGSSASSLLARLQMAAAAPTDAPRVVSIRGVAMHEGPDQASHQTPQQQQDRQSDQRRVSNSDFRSGEIQQTPRLSSPETTRSQRGHPQDAHDRYADHGRPEDAQRGRHEDPARTAPSDARMSPSNESGQRNSIAVHGSAASRRSSDRDRSRSPRNDRGPPFSDRLSSSTRYANDARWAGMHVSSPPMGSASVSSESRRESERGGSGGGYFDRPHHRSSGGLAPAYDYDHHQYRDRERERERERERMSSGHGYGHMSPRTSRSGPYTPYEGDRRPHDNQEDTYYAHHHHHPQHHRRSSTDWERDRFERGGYERERMDRERVERERERRLAEEEEEQKRRRRQAQEDEDERRRRAVAEERRRKAEADAAMEAENAAAAAAAERAKAAAAVEEAERMRKILDEQRRKVLEQKRAREQREAEEREHERARLQAEAEAEARAAALEAARLAAEAEAEVERKRLEEERQAREAAERETERLRAAAVEAQAKARAQAEAEARAKARAELERANQAKAAEAAASTARARTLRERLQAGEPSDRPGNSMTSLASSPEHGRTIAGAASGANKDATSSTGGKRARDQDEVPVESSNKSRRTQEGRQDAKVEGGSGELTLAERMALRVPSASSQHHRLPVKPQVEPSAQGLQRTASRGHSPDEPLVVSGISIAGAGRNRAALTDSSSSAGPASARASPAYALPSPTIPGEHGHLNAAGSSTAPSSTSSGMLGPHFAQGSVHPHQHHLSIANAASSAASSPVLPSGPVMAGGMGMGLGMNMDMSMAGPGPVSDAQRRRMLYRMHEIKYSMLQTEYNMLKLRMGGDLDALGGAADPAAAAAMMLGGAAPAVGGGVSVGVGVGPSALGAGGVDVFGSMSPSASAMGASSSNAGGALPGSAYPSMLAQGIAGRATGNAIPVGAAEHDGAAPIVEIAGRARQVMPTPTAAEDAAEHDASHQGAARADPASVPETAGSPDEHEASETDVGQEQPPAGKQVQQKQKQHQQQQQRSQASSANHKHASDGSAATSSSNPRAPPAPAPAPSTSLLDRFSPEPSTSTERQHRNHTNNNNHGVRDGQRNTRGHQANGGGNRGGERGRAGGAEKGGGDGASRSQGHHHQHHQHHHHHHHTNNGQGAHANNHRGRGSGAGAGGGGGGGDGAETSRDSRPRSNQHGNNEHRGGSGGGGAAGQQGRGRRGERA